MTVVGVADLIIKPDSKYKPEYMFWQRIYDERFLKQQLGLDQTKLDYDRLGQIRLDQCF